MEAERLIEVSRRALAQSRGAPSIMAEAWQVQALAQAIGEHLAAYGPKTLRGEARGSARSGEVAAVRRIIRWCGPARRGPRSSPRSPIPGRP